MVMAQALDCQRCGGPLALDPSAVDEFACRSCGGRSYAPAPDMGDKRADPLTCPECRRRVYGGWSGVGAVCGDCHYDRAIATILRTAPDADRQAVGQRVRARQR